MTYDDGNPGGIERSEDDVCPPADVVDSRGVMYTMMNYMLEISTVHSNLKRRSLRCRSSSQPLRSKSPSVLLSMEESPKGRPIQLLGSRL